MEEACVGTMGPVGTNATLASIVRAIICVCLLFGRKPFGGLLDETIRPPAWRRRCVRKDDTRGPFLEATGHIRSRYFAPRLAF